jgi:hypothetical protein
MHIRGIEAGSGTVKTGSRNTGRDREVDIQREALGGAEHIVHPLIAEDIDDFVGIRRYRCGAPGDHNAGILGGTEERRLDMDMGIHKRRSKV